MEVSEGPPFPTVSVSVDGGINEIHKNACAAILSSLPEWFGDAEAVSAYLRDLTSLELYLAERGSEIVGFAAVARKGFQVAEIHVMGVARDERRRGLGRSLIDRMVEDLARSGIKSLTVQTLGPSDADPAYAETRAFYEAMGFVPLREFRQKSWTDPTMVMTRSL